MIKNLKSKKLLETRSLPPLVEEMNNHIAEMESLVAGAKTETRALNADEVKKFNELKSKVDNIKETLKVEEELRSKYTMTPVQVDKVQEERSLEEMNFLNYVKGEYRALDVGNNGAIIPQTIANKIIEKVKELSPIYSLATIYNVGGDLIFPVYEESMGSAVTANYVDDMAELTEGNGSFKTVKLTNYIVGCLAKVSKSLINRQDFDLLSFIVDKVAQAISEFIEKELIAGETKAHGLAKCEREITTVALKADDLIDLQMEVKERFQNNCVWIMHKDNVKAIRKLKDGDGNYLLNRDFSTQFGWSLLGKTVYFTESCSKENIYYGDMSGLYVKLTKNVELQLLTEKYATQHALGCCGYIEFDSKIVEPEKIAVLKVGGGRSATK